ncbi:inovirus-type Gp2 protein [Vibrio parahaemolyticus]|nr:inovirus-type Gp2 protein [Vibrio parahaemolyticus]
MNITHSKVTSCTHYCPKRLQDMTNVVHHALAKHQSVTLYRFDVRFPVIAEDLQKKHRLTPFTKKFLGSLKAKLEHRYGRIAEFDYLWSKVNHIESGAMPHYQFVIMLDTHLFNAWQRGNHQGPSFKTYVEKAYMSAMDLKDVQDNVLLGKALMIAATHHSKNQQEHIIKMLSYLAKRHHPLPGQRCWDKSNIPA